MNETPAPLSVTDLLADTERLLTNKELAAIMRVPEKTCRVWASNGTGPRRIRVGRYVRYRAGDVTAWLNDSYVDEHDPQVLGQRARRAGVDADDAVVGVPGA